MIQTPQELAHSFLAQLDQNINLKDVSNQVDERFFSEHSGVESLRLSLIHWLDKFSIPQTQQNDSASEILYHLAKGLECLHYPLISRVCCQLIVDSYQDQSEWISKACIFLAEHYEKLNQNLVAIQSYQKLIELDRDKHIAYNRIGLIFMSINENSQALMNFQRSLNSNPKYLQAQINLGVALQNQEAYQEAIRSFEVVIEQDPSQINAYYNLGIACFSCKSFDLSIRALRIALHLNPSLLDAHYNLGVVYSEIKQYRTALDCYKSVIKLNPNYLLAHYNSGVCYFELLEYSQAVESYKKAMLIDPQHIRSHWNIAHCHLILGELKTGFLEYEWRWKHNELQNQQTQRKFDKPLWLGDLPLEGKCILLHAEQGLGDTLQFVRFANALIQGNNALIIEVQPALKSLIEMSFKVNNEGNKSNLPIRVISRGEKLPPYDLHCPLMSLPLAMGISKLSDLSEHSAPYLSVDSELKLYWAKKLDDLIRDRNLHNAPGNAINFNDANLKSNDLRFPRRPRIGLIWSSGYRDDQQDTWEINKQRNLNLYELEPLLKLPLDWVSLQIGKIPNQELRDLNQIGWRGSSLLDLSGEIRNFADTAAIAQNLDLIISVDTSTAHLCGALGLRTWILLKANSCWRWFLMTEESPWYPNAQLFRQTHRADWSGVLQQLELQLNKFIETRKTRNNWLV